MPSSVTPSLGGSISSIPSPPPPPTNPPAHPARIDSPPLAIAKASEVYEAVFSVQRRLDDEDATVWSYDEILLYLKDGYDLLCRLTKCLFDMHVIENTPPMGNWGTDLERYIATQTPGMQLTDDRLHFTGEHERDALIGGRLGGSTEGPVNTTGPYITPEGGGVPSALPAPDSPAVASSFNIPTEVALGRLPDTTVDVVRVTYDGVELFAEGSAEMRKLDNRYETLDGGDPRHFTMDKDGLLTIRLVPPARGDADYPQIVGSWGTLTQTSSSSIPTFQTVGVWGILREIEGVFPAGGPDGTPTRIHPAEKNIIVEIFRLGRPLEVHGFEIPQSFVKYVMFWAMHRALKRDGPGQDLTLAKHYADRFTMGVDRMKTRLRKTFTERVLKMSSGRGGGEAFGLGDPQLPYPYGPSTGRRYD